MNNQQKTFKFQTFANQMATFDIRKKTLYNIEHKNECFDNENSYFCETIKKWRTLNLTSEFIQIEKDLSNIQNLKQLVFNKEYVCNYLILAFERITDDCLQSFLEIIISVARDLSNEFYPYFLDIFDHLKKNLQTKNAEKLEWILKCIAQLFKVLKKEIKKDLFIIFQKILPLFSSEDYIVNFMAECLAFVTREFGKIREFIHVIIDNVQDIYIVGCGRLLFEMVHGVSNNFHSGANDILENLFDMLFDSTINRQSLYKIHVQLMTDILEQINKKHLQIYIDIFSLHLKRAVELSEIDKECIELHLLLYGQLIEGSDSSFLVDFSMEQVLSLFDRSIDDDTVSIIVKICSVLILSKHSTMRDILCNRMIKKIFSIKSYDIIQDFILATVNSDVFNMIIMPTFIKYISYNFSQNMLETLAKVFIAKNFDGSGIKKDIITNIHQNELLAKNLCNLINEQSTSDIILTILLCLPNLCRTIEQSTLQKLSVLTKYVNQEISKTNSTKEFMFLLLLFQTRMIFDYNEDLVNDAIVTVSYLNSTVVDFKSSIMLQLLKICLNILKFKDHETLNNSIRLSVTDKLCKSLASHCPKTRMSTIECLKALDNINKEMFQTMIEIEKKPVDVFNYREHIILYDKLRLYIEKNVELTSSRMYVLQFFLGQLHKNFKLLWEPLMNNIVKIITDLPVSSFWPILKINLQHQIQQNSIEHYNESANNEILKQLLSQFEQTQVNHHDSRHRIFIWKILSQLSCCDDKNREIVELYLSFYRNEYEYVDHNMSDDCRNNDTLAKGSQLKLLKAQLEVIYVLKNPFTIYKKDEVCETLKELLIQHSSDISLIAVKCLLRIKFKNTAPEMRERLIELMEGKPLSEITIETQFFKEQPELLDIIMRIVHSRLVLHHKKNDRIAYLVYKRRILAFLKNFSKQNINVFLSITFNAINCAENNLNRINKKFLLANLQLLSLISSELRGYIDEKGVKSLIEVILKISFLCIDQPFEAEIRSKMSQCLCCIFSQFYEINFENLYENIFSSIIWPQMKSFEKDCIVSISGLFKLFIEWSKNPKYFTLLFRKHPDDLNSSPMDNIFKLLMNISTSNHIKMTIYKLLINIISDSDNFSDHNTMILPYYHLLLRALNNDIHNDVIMLEKLDIIPFLEILMETQNIDLNEFFKVILNLINSKKVLKNEDKLKSLLKILSSSNYKLNDTKELIGKIAPLFDYITNIDNRKLLCRVYKNISNLEDDSNILMCKIIEHINAFDRRWNNQPDYNKRYEAFTFIDRFVEMYDWREDLVHLLFHNCMYILTNDSDIFLRNQAFKYSVLIIKNIDSRFDDCQIKKLINGLFLNTIARKLKNPKVKCRSECIQLLGELVYKFTEHNEVLQNFRAISNKKDIEQDFFANIVHLQENIQHRAIMKYVKLVQSDICKFSQQSLVKFIIPIFAYYICNEKYRKNSKIIEVVTMAISESAGKLTWNNYKTLLKEYLIKLSKEIQFRKQMINVCIGILNSFHFKEDFQDRDNKQSYEKVLNFISNDILPSLLKIINDPSSLSPVSKTRDEKYTSDRENVLMLSLAQPVVKLLQKLPKTLFDLHFASVIYKTSVFLKSRSKAVRIIAKDTLRKILVFVGPNYLEPIVNHLSSCLTKSNEIHILTVNINCLIESIIQSAKPSHLESILNIILKICLTDICRPTDNYKNGMRLLNRRNDTMPSKKSYNTLEILASGISEKSILDIITCIKEKINIAHSYIEIHRIQECLDRVVIGLCKNRNIKKEKLLILSHGILCENIDELFLKKENDKMSNTKKTTSPIDVNSLLIPAQPRRKSNTIQKGSKWKSDTNANLLIRFGLTILHTLLKQKMIVSKEFHDYLDLHISKLIYFVRSTDVKIKILALKCVSCMWKFKIKTNILIEHEPNLIKCVFEIIQKYVDQTIVCKDENLQLIKYAFKSTILFLKNIYTYELIPAEIELLLSFVQNEMDNPNQNSMAFALLKTIIEKKLQSKTISLVINKLMELSIYSEYEWTRNQSKLVILLHLNNYPSNKNQDYCIKFYLKNVRTELRYLQKSSIFMVHQLVGFINQELFNNHWNSLMKKLNELFLTNEFETNWSRIEDSLKIILKRLGIDQLDKVFNQLKVSFQEISKFKENKRTSLKLCTLLLETQKSFFSEKLNDIIPEILICLMPTPVLNIPGKFVLQNHGNKSAVHNQLKENTEDHIYDTLNLCSIILEEYPLNSTKFIYSSQLAKAIISLAPNYLHRNSTNKIKILYLHLVKKIWSQISVTNYILAVQHNHEIDGLPFSSPREEIKNLVQSLLTESQDCLDESTLKIIISLFFEIAMFVSKIDTTIFDVQKINSKNLDFIWICRTFSQFLRTYSGKTKSAALKIHLYKYLEKNIEQMKCEQVLLLAKYTVDHLYRDMNSEDSFEVKDFATRVWKCLIQKIENQPLMASELQLVFKNAKSAYEDQKNKTSLKRKITVVGNKKKKIKN